MREDRPALRSDWFGGKSHDRFAPMGPVLVPKEFVDDHMNLFIRLTVNGDLRQDGNTSQMLHAVPQLIEEASRWMTLERGDLLFTGTPAGVGPLVPGDRVVAELDRVGTLEVEVEGR